MIELKHAFNLTTTPDKGHDLSISARNVSYLELVKTLSMQVLAIRSSGLSLPPVSWYDEAHDWVKKTSENYYTPVHIVAGVVAALSPQNKWNTNKRDTLSLITWHRTRCQTLKPCPKVSTFNSNRDKALMILEQAETLLDIDEVCKVILKAPKTSSFARNISGDKTAVTIDLWALRASLMLPVNTKVSCTKTAYKVIEQAYNDVASSVGSNACDLQSTQWVVLRYLAGKGGLSNDK